MGAPLARGAMGRGQEREFCQVQKEGEGEPSEVVGNLLGYKSGDPGSLSSNSVLNQLNEVGKSCSRGGC